MKKILILSASVASLTASMATAGGMEVGRFSPGFMFESGNFAEISMTRTTPKVTDDTFAPGGSMLAEMTNTSLSVKMAVNDRLSIGMQHYDAAKIALSYVGTGGPFSTTPDPYATQVSFAEAMVGDAATQAAVTAYAPTALAAGASTATEIAAYALANDAATKAALGVYMATKYGGAAKIPLAAEPNVDLAFKSTVLVANYKVSDRIDVFGGIKYSSGSATGNVLINPHGDISASEASATSPVLGVSYSIPDIALRVTATYQGKAETSHATEQTYGGATTALKNTKAALPESITLDFQTGIAADTLLFGSIHHAKWGDAQIYFDGSSVAKSTWTDSTNYSLGVGRKLNENWAVSASVNYEEGTEASGTSLLSTTNGVRGLTLGARYTMDNMTFSVGVNHSQFGDKTVVAAPLGTGKFTNNSMTSVGVKVGFSF